MRLNAMNSTRPNDKDEPRPLPPVNLRRWGGQVQTIRDPYSRESSREKIGFRGEAENVRDDKNE